MTFPAGAPRLTRVQAVLEATAKSLVDGGYNALTVDRIASAAHASKATIYKSWPTKIDLVCAVAAGTVPVVVPVPEAGVDLVDAVTEIARAVRSVTLGETGRLLLALHEASRAEDRIARAVDEHLVAPQHAAIAEAFRALQRDSRISSDVDAALGARIIASIFIDRALVGGEPVGDDELDEILTGWLVPALAPRVTSGRTLGPPAGPG